MEEMMMEELFEEVLGEVMEAHGCEGWWEVVDSDLWHEVMEQIADRYGVSVLESDEFIAWEDQLMEDL